VLFSKTANEYGAAVTSILTAADSRTVAAWAAPGVAFQYQGTAAAAKHRSCRAVRDDIDI
jgi:hypothetical protein